MVAQAKIVVVKSEVEKPIVAVACLLYTSMQQKRSQNSGRIIDMKHYTVEITNEALADMEQLLSLIHI